MVRAKQDAIGDREHERVLPLLLHGDAAFAGQGIVAETLHLSGLHGYRTGGTIHVVVNNQIGFTTLPEDARSSTYASDVAKMVHAPVFHVNGDDPEAVAYVAGLALEYRQRFKKDVVVDLVCYRRFGHNETDEPSYTQPLMYSRIKSHPSVATLYGDELVREQVLSGEERERLWADKKAAMQSEEEPPTEPFATIARREPVEPAPVDESAMLGRLRTVLEALGALPDGFEIHPKLVPFVRRRAELLEGRGDVDWATAESLAWGTLLLEGIPVRLSGQDSGRGTFSQRHAVLSDVRTGEEHVPLNAVAAGGRPLRGARLAPLGGGGDGLRVRLLGGRAPRARDVGGSVRRLHERRAGHHRPVPVGLGAEVGTADRPRAAPAPRPRGAGARALLGPDRALPDPVRRGQHAGRLPLDAGLVLPPAPLAGPRLDREAAGGLHPQEPPPEPALRLHPARAGLGSLRAGARRPRRPTPPEPAGSCCAPARSTSTCSRPGRNGGHGNVALVRLEQLYPFPVPQLQDVLGRYSSPAELVWAQEEPRNMGAWRFVRESVLDGLVDVGWPDPPLRRPGGLRRPGPRLAPDPRRRAGSPGPRGPRALGVGGHHTQLAPWGAGAEYGVPEPPPFGRPAGGGYTRLESLLS